ncbi:hypothetical protein NM208_g7781 [Fusarium decemcellulare]|uniref:Uncharacterized protein n=2 Tax=Fusarium decemcellulare TaxID=57161 RepID=A0ACC1S7T3_9HYPO|nr:hypothetical protein NM208_g7793 [Fusarium decemcellulare]KAJ3533903.1 hypothetical protein NM208_g7781 [Fusarium decemcellulare]
MMNMESPISRDFVPHPVQVGANDQATLLSSHCQTDTLQSIDEAVSGAENAPQGPITVQAADNNIPQEDRPAPLQRMDTFHTTIQNRVRSWADTGTRVQTKGKLRLKELGNRIKEPGPTTKLKQHIAPTLRNRIFMESVTSHHPQSYRGRFLPLEKLKVVLGEDAVEKQLAKCKGRRKTTHSKNSSPIDIPGIKAEVQAVMGTLVRDTTQTDAEHKSYLKILAILILIKRRSMIYPFMKAGLCDAHLPLSLENAADSTPWKLRRKDGQEVSRDNFRDWKKSSFARFIEKQWIVLAPSFDNGCDTKEDLQMLSGDHVLPFISWVKLSEGGFGKVYKVQIHPSCHSFNSASAPRTPYPSFALKKVYIHKSFNPEYEFNVLRKFRNDRHKHLISLLAAYIQHDAYHLIFPWAKADLLDYWRLENPKPLEAERQQVLIWLAEQCRGLAEGLSFIHRYETVSFERLLHPTSFPLQSKSLVRRDGDKEVRRLFGRHGDIKPANILWFPGHCSERGILKITDFGIAEFSTQQEVNSNRRDSFANSPTYRPPETDLRIGDGTVSASYDIWTLGCVYLEFLTWWLGGWASVDKFAKQRLDSDTGLWQTNSLSFKSDAFFTITKDEAGKSQARVKTKVTEVSAHKISISI